MPLTKPKGVVENFKPKGGNPHTHTCKCGKVWACNLAIDPEDRAEWAKRKVNLTKLELVCWWDDDPNCVKCEAA
jgi:hypothetical protein